MAVGWANDDSVSQQIQNTIDDEISRFVAVSQGVKAPIIAMSVVMRSQKHVVLL